MAGWPSLHHNWWRFFRTGQSRRPPERSTADRLGGQFWFMGCWTRFGHAWLNTTIFGR